MDDLQRKDEQTQSPAPKKHRLLGMVITLVVVLAVVLVVAYRDGTGLDVLRRYFNYGGSDTVEATGYAYEADSSNRFGLLGDRLVVVSNTMLRILADDGTEVYSLPVSMQSASLSVGGGYAAAVDIGGSELVVVDREGECLTLNADEGEPFLAATFNSSGYLAVTQAKKNYKCSVSVYDSQMQLVFTFNSAQRFVLDAWVTENNRSLAAVTLGQENSEFVSNIVLYDLDNTEPRANFSIQDGLVLAMGQVSGRLAVVADNCLAFADTSGEIKATYDYSGEYLREYDLRGDDYAVLLLNRYRSGSVGRLVTVDDNGEEVAQLDVRSEVRSLSAAGRYIAVLYADQLVIYNQNLEKYASLTGVDSTKSVLMRDDGSVVLVGSREATLYVP